MTDRTFSYSFWALSTLIPDCLLGTFASQSEQPYNISTMVTIQVSIPVLVSGNEQIRYTIRLKNRTNHGTYIRW